MVTSSKRADEIPREEAIPDKACQDDDKQGLRGIEVHDVKPELVGADAGCWPTTGRTIGIGRLASSFTKLLCWIDSSLSIGSIFWTDSCVDVLAILYFLIHHC